MQKLKKIKIPEIRFKNGWLLTGAFVAYMKEIKRFDDHKIPSREDVSRVVVEREKIWKGVEKKIIESMQKIAGLNFYQNLIDVYTVYGWKTAFSDPLVLSMKYEREDFVDVLTHEILHRLLTDNLQNKNGSSWAEKNYPDIEDKKVTNHILVHAIHKEIYVEVLKRPDRLAKDIEKCLKWPSYKMAWEIVEKDGHMSIIDRFKTSE